MMQRFKLIYLGVYVMFLITFILFFVAALNMSVSKIVYFLMALLLLIEGTALFFLSVYTQKITTVKAVLKEEIRENDIVTNETDVVNEQDRIVNIDPLIPTQKLSLNSFSDELLVNIAKQFKIAQGLFYIRGSNEVFSCCGQYAYFSDKKPADFKIGENINGQAAKNKTIVALNNIPDDYMVISSGLGKGLPKQLVLVPLIVSDEVVGLIEFALFENLSEVNKVALEQLSTKVAGLIVKFIKK
jgi:hypothetical protein